MISESALWRCLVKIVTNSWCSRQRVLATRCLTTLHCTSSDPTLIIYMCGIRVCFAELTVCLPTTLCRSGPCSGQPDAKHGTVSYMWVVTCHNGTAVQFQPQTAATQTVQRSSPRYWSRIAELSPCTWHVYSAYFLNVPRWHSG